MPQKWHNSSWCKDSKIITEQSKGDGVRMRTAPFLFRRLKMQQDESTNVERTLPESVIRVSDVFYSYSHPDTKTVEALSGISLSIEKGKHIAILGRNGSGKSTLAKLINVLETPGRGTVAVFGRSTVEDANFWYIRSRCGMVFQNPDNQIVGTSVEEDVAFGPENLGIPTGEIRERVDAALKYVGLEDLALRAPSSLSGGQKQKLAIAGILSMMPEVLILDESTAMLDPVSRNEFLHLIKRMQTEKGITVLHITHDMSEAYYADYVYVLEKGQIALEGTPGDIFFQADRVRSLGLDVPVFAGLLIELCKRIQVAPRREWFLSRKAAIAAIQQLLPAQNPVPHGVVALPNDFSDAKTVLSVSGLSYAYDSLGKKALEDISFSVREGEIFAVIGHSGSGKTTLISHLNGLIRPQTGEVLFYDEAGGATLDTKKNADVRNIRRRVGLLFQYPEYQLFEETVRKDIAFGPMKMGLDKVAVEKRVLEAIKLVGLDETFLERSPFELSGGQKRRVAFAGIIAMDPDILVLDEPAAGLDPTGRQEVFQYILELRKSGKTIILVSHNMDEAARYADRLLVLSKGRITRISTPDKLFEREDDVHQFGLELPELVSCLQELKAGLPELKVSVFDIGEAAAELIRASLLSVDVTQKPAGGSEYD